MTHARPVPARRVAVAAVLAASLGCGSGAEATRETPPAAQPEVASAGAETPAEATATAAAMPLGPVSWQLFQRIRIDDSGTVFYGSRREGELHPDGTMTGRHGELAARIDADGSVLVGERPTRLRIVGATLVEVGGSPGAWTVRVEGSELVLGTEEADEEAEEEEAEEEEERTPIEGFRPELAREVLFVSAILIDGMAHAFAH